MINRLLCLIPSKKMFRIIFQIRELKYIGSTFLSIDANGDTQSEELKRVHAEAINACLEFLRAHLRFEQTMRTRDCAAFQSARLNLRDRINVLVTAIRSMHSAVAMDFSDAPVTVWERRKYQYLRNATEPLNAFSKLIGGILPTLHELVNVSEQMSPRETESQSTAAMGRRDYDCVAS